MTLAAGTRLGPYEILAPLGAGGMGEVYRARDPRLGREVAIKVLPASFSQDADRLRRFEQEARAAGVLNHPNITAVYDIGTHEGAPYVVTELLEGETLRSRARGRALSPRKAIDYALQIAHGPRRGAREGDRPPGPEAREPLRHEGRAGQDPRLRPREADAAGGPGAAGRRTCRPATAGTEPGVVLGHARLHVARAGAGQDRPTRGRDIFSFGAILYEMLSGQRAFQRRLGGRHDVGDPAGGAAGPLARRTRTSRPGLERIVRHCLEKNPEAAVPVRARPRLRPRGAVGDSRRRDAQAALGSRRAETAGGSCRDRRCGRSSRAAVVSYLRRARAEREAPAFRRLVLQKTFRRRRSSTRASRPTERRSSTARPRKELRRRSSRFAPTTRARVPWDSPAFTCSPSPRGESWRS